MDVADTYCICVGSPPLDRASACAPRSAPCLSVAPAPVCGKALAPADGVAEALPMPGTGFPDRWAGQDRPARDALRSAAGSGEPERDRRERQQQAERHELGDDEGRDTGEARSEICVGR
ncbi:hypothetical protein R2601_03798 [Salipiger bermudensis HTCC2601]|uniref:Uncharacterized protein n=1 Tax=Salipiger bermudensis (strain DSM 26914 / JCM 13377 / KCTC 12554 / HTCC2601) TaxID=314265 RepID=Q0FW86_SALBH|nr:hypothetical protein R2601_03798 [Salipiger bermudensis HTCC2601]